MEAASARMASRSRFADFGEPAHSTLQRYICEFETPPRSPSISDLVPDNACEPQNFEPNLALNLEVADLINSKKGNAYGYPRLRLAEGLTGRDITGLEKQQSQSST